MRTLLSASIIAVFAQIGTAAAHDAWFVRVCPGKTEGNRIYLQFGGNRQGFTWTWNRAQTPNERALPDRFRTVSRLYIRGQTVPVAGKLQPHAYICIGFRDHIVQRMDFDDHEDHEKKLSDTDDCAC